MAQQRHLTILLVVVRLSPFHLLHHPAGREDPLG
jgi:hypothetical protein